jgi:hypothetical protein
VVDVNVRCCVAGRRRTDGRGDGGLSTKEVVAEQGRRVRSAGLDTFLLVLCWRRGAVLSIVLLLWYGGSATAPSAVHQSSSSRLELMTSKPQSPCAATEMPEIDA